VRDASQETNGPPDQPSDNERGTLPTTDETAATFRAFVRSLKVPHGTVLVELHDDLDLSVAKPLFLLLEGLVQKGAGSSAVSHLVLDMTDVAFLDSAGLSILLEIRRRLIERDGTLRLFGAPRQIVRVLQIANLLAYLPVHTTEADALQAIHQWQSQKS
jgi:anti-anti-sigma factor